MLTNNSSYYLDEYFFPSPLVLVWGIDLLDEKFIAFKKWIMYKGLS